MRTLNMTAGYDKDLIWVFKINLDLGTVYLSTNDIQLTNFYDGKVLKINQHSEKLTDGELSYSGGMSVLGSMSLLISNSTDNTTFNSWYDSFYPNNSVYIINRETEVGIVWNTATSDTQITWLSDQNVIDYSYTGDQTDLLCYANNEFTNVNIPHYKVQDTYDDGISYIEDVSTDEQGSVIPLIYGSFNQYLTRPALLGKSILFDKDTLEYKYAYHECYSDEASGILLKYISGINSFMRMEADVYTKTNSFEGSSIQLNPTTRVYGSDIKGTLYMYDFVVGSESEVFSIKELDNDITTDYVSIPVGDKLSITLNSSVSTSDTGLLDPLTANAAIFGSTLACGTGTSSVDIRRNSDRGSTTSASVSVTTTPTINQRAFGTTIDKKPNQELPWTLEELSSIEYIIENTGSEIVRVSDAYVLATEITIQQFYGNITIRRG